MHLRCTHSRLLWPHYRQAVQEAARHLPLWDKALLVASWRSAGVEWTEVFCSGLVPDAGVAQLGTAFRYDLTGGNSLDEFSQHKLRLVDFAWELRIQRLEQLLCTPHSVAVQVHWWLTSAEGDPPSPPLRPGKDFVASLRLVNGTLECPAQEVPHLHLDLPRGFSGHLRGAFVPPCFIGLNSMTAWEASIFGADWAEEWSWWCATTRSTEAPAERYAAIPREGWGDTTSRSRRRSRGHARSVRGTQKPRRGCVLPRSAIQDGEATYPRSYGRPCPPG